MPNTIDITDNGTTYNLNADGEVLTGGANWGTWSVKADNSISLTPNGGGAMVDFTAKWSFLNNDLIVLLTPVAAAVPAAAPAAQPAPINLHAIFPYVDYSIEAQTGHLTVAAAGAGASFIFVIAGVWDLTQSYNLEYTPAGGTASTLVGRVKDSRSRFNFQFDDTSTDDNYALVFPGNWSMSVVNAKIQLTFTFPWNDPATGNPQAFQLTEAALSVDHDTSLLQITYNKTGANKGWQVLLVGKANIVNGVFFSYDLVDQNGNFTGTQFVIGAKVGGTLTGGTVQFSLLDQNNQWVPVLTYKGNVSIGTAKGTIGFSIQPKAVNQSFLPINLNLTGTFSMNDGADTVELNVGASGLTLAISVTDFKLGTLDPGDVWFKIAVNGTGKSVGFSMIFGFAI